jgi:predicted nucleic-acid-binding Zn-ribbon protein
MSNEKKCTKCGGTDLRSGEFQSTGKIYFRPKGSNMASILTGGLPVEAEACLNCGHLELVVDAVKANTLIKKS